ncbi:MAG: histidine kinase [Burkholderiaceae bacterium]|nr:histidine kinase [Burkholderiaceae bacterium]
MPASPAAPASPPCHVSDAALPTADNAQLVALRNAELSDLLGHLHNCWDNERRSLSRQLHDSLGSSLTALTMHLGMLTLKLPPDPALQDRLAQMKQLLLQVVETNRQMQMQLWNDKLEFLGVRVALCEVVDQFGAQQQLHTSCRLPEHELHCPRSHAVVLLHALEEGLRNVAAHAHASAIDVQVDETPQSITLRLGDNGVGPAADATLGGGKFGLRTVRERAAYLGGTLTLSARAQGGSMLTVSLPLTTGAPAAAPPH